MTFASPLITAEELVNQLHQPKLKLFDVRGTWRSPARAEKATYDKSHIAGAAFLDWTTEFIEQDAELSRASVASHSEARNSFSRLGINQDDTVVLYDDYHHMFAGRLWWAMRYWGFTNVKVLNGGWKQWNSLALPVSRKPSEFGNGQFQPIENPGLRISMTDFISNKDKFVLLDARGEANYRGDPKNPDTGHIPGAINLPYQIFLDERTGLFKEKEVIASIFDRCILNWRSAWIVNSCGSGYAGTIPMIALWRYGITSRLFDDSFAGWKSDSARPIVQVN